MMKTLSIFQRLLFFLLLMMAIIMFVFWFIYQLNVKDLQVELSKNKMNEVKFMTSQLKAQFQQTLMNTIVLAQDQSVREYPYILHFGDQYAKYDKKLEVIDKLALNSASTSWNNIIILYYLEGEEMVSSDPNFSFSQFKVPVQPYHKWNLVQGDTEYYSHILKSHFSELLIEVRISLDDLRKMMRQYSSGIPVMYDAGKGVFIFNENDLSGQAYQEVKPLITGKSGTISLEYDHTDYIVSFMKVNTMDLYFIDFQPRQNFISPIARNSRYFFFAAAMVLIGLLFYTLMLRRQVQQPVSELRKAINKFDRGDFSSRVNDLQANEFSKLGSSYNRMADNIQKLIEQVLRGEIEVKEAKLKQYQAQINPHFLYNCLNFIQSKASVKDYQSVTQMTLHLGAYCRYIHNIEQVKATLREELTYIEHFLSIVHLRKREISFQLNVPEHMHAYRVPRMLLQPLVENCVKHGIEPTQRPGVISVEAEEDETEFRVIVKDNGIGMTEERLAAVQRHINDIVPTNISLGTGIRNVGQRIQLYFGNGSGLTIESRPNGGSRYIVRIRELKEEQRANTVGG